MATASAAVEDFIGLLEAVIKLYTGNPLELRFTYSPEIKGEQNKSNPDIKIIFDDQYSHDSNFLDSMSMTATLNI